MFASIKRLDEGENFSGCFVEVGIDKLFKSTESISSGEDFKLKIRCEYPEIQIFNSITHAIPDPSVPVRLVVELRHGDVVVKEDDIFLQLFFPESDEKARDLYRELSKVQIRYGLLEEVLGRKQSFLLEKTLVKKFQGGLFSLGSYEYPHAEITIPVILLKKGGKLAEFLKEVAGDEVDCLFLSESLGFSVFQNQIACSNFYLQEAKKAVADVVRQAEEFKVVCRFVKEGLYEFAVFPGRDINTFLVKVKEKLPESLPHFLEDKQILWVYHGLFGQSLSKMFDRIFGDDFFSMVRYFRNVEMKEIGNGEKVLSFVVGRDDIVRMLEEEKESLKKEREMIEDYYRELVERIESIRNLLSSSSCKTINKITVTNKGPKILQ